MTSQNTELDANYRALLGLMLENVHIGVSNEDIVVDTEVFAAPAHLRAALVTLMEEWVDGEAECICLPELLPAVAVNCRADQHIRPVPSADTEASR